MGVRRSAAHSACCTPVSLARPKGRPYALPAVPKHKVTPRLPSLTTGTPANVHPSPPLCSAGALPHPSPGVWTNTCCSHQLVGQDPEEVDTDADIAAGRAPGAEAAARRKLKHELGIDPGQVPPLRYLTRLHYCARDADTHGPDAPWGEHEVDYILLGRLPAGRELALDPHPEEVAAVKYVTAGELAEMMAPASGLKWSPWFRIIATHFLPAWWEDLDAVLADGKHADAAAIHRIDC